MSGFPATATFGDGTIVYRTGVLMPFRPSRAVYQHQCRFGMILTRCRYGYGYHPLSSPIRLLAASPHHVLAGKRSPPQAHCWRRNVSGTLCAPSIGCRRAALLQRYRMPLNQPGVSRVTDTQNDRNDIGLIGMPAHADEHDRAEPELKRNVPEQDRRSDAVTRKMAGAIICKRTAIRSIGVTPGPASGSGCAPVA